MLEYEPKGWLRVIRRSPPPTTASTVIGETLSRPSRDVAGCRRPTARSSPHDWLPSAASHLRGDPLVQWAWWLAGTDRPSSRGGGPEMPQSAPPAPCVLSGLTFGALTHPVHPGRISRDAARTWSAIPGGHTVVSSQITPVTISTPSMSSKDRPAPNAMISRSARALSRSRTLAWMPSRSRSWARPLAEARSLARSRARALARAWARSRVLARARRISWSRRRAGAR